MKFLPLFSAFGLVATTSSQGAYTFSGTTITETFAGLPATNQANFFSATVGVQTAITGTEFVGTKLSGSSTLAGLNSSGLVVDNGAGASGAVYSYGPTGDADRALGLLASGTNVMGFGFEMINGAAQPLTEFVVSFTQENWRGSTVAVNTIAASYATTGSAGVTSANFLSSTTGFTAVTTLSLVGPAFGASNGALDGNNLTNQVARSFTFTGLNLLPGESFYLRFQDSNDGGSDAGLAIDGLTISVPEPASTLLGALGLLAVLRRRR